MAAVSLGRGAEALKQVRSFQKLPRSERCTRPLRPRGRIEPPPHRCPSPHVRPRSTLGHLWPWHALRSPGTCSCPLSGLRSAVTASLACRPGVPDPSPRRCPSSSWGFLPGALRVGARPRASWLRLVLSCTPRAWPRGHAHTAHTVLPGFGPVSLELVHPEPPPWDPPKVLYCPGPEISPPVMWRGWAAAQDPPSQGPAGLPTHGPRGPPCAVGLSWPRLATTVSWPQGWGCWGHSGNEAARAQHTGRV